MFWLKQNSIFEISRPGGDYGVAEYISFPAYILFQFVFK